MEHTHKLQEDISAYKKEKECLSDENTYLQNIITCNPVFSNLFLEYSKAEPEKRIDQLKTSINSQSFFLLSMLYSFGMFYNPDSTGQQALLNRGFFPNPDKKENSTPFTSKPLVNVSCT